MTHNSCEEGTELPFTAIAHRKTLAGRFKRPLILRSSFDFASAANGSSPEGFSMRAVAQQCLPGDGGPR